MFDKPIVGYQVNVTGIGGGAAHIVVTTPEELWLAVKTALNLADVHILTIDRVIEIKNLPT